VKERNTVSEASLSTPPRRPSVRALKPAVIEALASVLAPSAVAELTPRSRTHDSISSAPAWSLSLRLSAWLAMPLRTMIPTPTPIRAIPRKTIVAPAPLGTPRRFNQSTSGTVTEAMIPAVITGITIVSVSDSSQIAPSSAAPTPTSSQAEKPRSRIQAGAEKIPLSSAGSTSMNSSSPPALSGPGRRSRPRRIARLRLIGAPDDTRRLRHGRRRAAA